MRIRTATAEDAAAIADLLGQLGYPTDASAIPPRLARMAAEPNQHTLLAEVDGRVVGMLTLGVRHAINQDAPVARLTSVIVSQEFRSRGVGSALIAEAGRVAREAGCAMIEVTSGSHRERAHELYRRLGYEQRSVRFVKTL